MRTLELPLATPSASPQQVSAEYYYRIPVRPIYRSFPVYRPDREPQGYLDSLRAKEPEVAFDATKLKTPEDWIRAGEWVFDAPIDFVSSGLLYTETRGMRWYESNHVPTTSDGQFPFMRYVIRERGRIELGFAACAGCHTRVMPDGSIIKGAQGNFPDDRAFAYEIRIEAAQAADPGAALADFRDFMRRHYASPWAKGDPNGKTQEMSLDELASALEAIPPGVCARQGSSPFYPVRIPDLIGLKDLKYLDASGLVRHRDAGDLMRYAALNQGGDRLALYGEFRPVGELPDPATESRYSDEQLYALTQYLYSLKPPPNPHLSNRQTARGKSVFNRADCGTCHTTPLYTNNKLMPADGFEVPDEHLKTNDVLPMYIGTDPRLAVASRRGTGYYKVPSLRGLWYRGPLGHDGTVATLEDWFDPKRLEESYVPTGFRGHGVESRAVPGHPYGLYLSDEDRAAMIAFLRTL